MIEFMTFKHGLIFEFIGLLQILLVLLWLTVNDKDSRIHFYGENKCYL